MTSHPRAHAISVSQEFGEASSLTTSSYSDSFEIPAAATDRDAEEWMRTVFEGAPPALRWCLLTGWRIALGLRPGPLRSSRHILGWPILTSRPEFVVLDQRSGLISAQILLHIEEPRLVWTTFVNFERKAALPVWTAVGLIHRRIVPYLLEQAVSRTSPPP